MNQYWYNQRTNTKKVPHVRLQKYLAKKQQSRSRKNLNFPAPLYVRLAAHVSNGLKSRIRPVVGRI